MYGWELLTQKLTLQRSTSILLLLGMALSFGLAYQPTWAAQQSRLLTGETVDRELTRDDLSTIQAAMSAIEQDAVATNKPPLLLMLGSTKGGLAETIMTHSNIQVIRFPNKDKEQPPYDALIAFLDTLKQTSSLYVWYDPSVTALEQRFYNQQTLQPITSLTTSFQANISLYRISE